MSAEVPIDLEAIKRGSAVRSGALGTYQGPAIIRATEQQRTEHAVREQMGGATFKIETEKMNTIKGWRLDLDRIWSGFNKATQEDAEEIWAAIIDEEFKT